MTQRIASERAYHDAEAASRAVTFAREPGRLRMRDSDYLDHAVWIRPAIATLGDLRGRRVLDFGCGHGMAGVVMARRGAQVTACDLSPGYVREAAGRARANEAAIDFTVADGHQLPFATGCFDLIWGHAILHHLEIRRCVEELRRVLRPGGRLTLCEPWDGAWWVRAIRRWRRHTADERALRHADVDVIRQVLGSVRMTTYQWSRYVVITAE